MRSTIALFSLVALSLAGCGQPPCKPKKGKKCRRSEAVSEKPAMPEPAKQVANAN